MTSQGYWIIDEFLIIGCVYSYIPSEECKLYNCSMNNGYIVAWQLSAYYGLWQIDHSFLPFFPSWLIYEVRIVRYQIWSFCKYIYDHGLIWSLYKSNMIEYENQFFSTLYNFYDLRTNLIFSAGFGVGTKVSGL